MVYMYYMWYCVYDLSKWLYKILFILLDTEREFMSATHFAVVLFTSPPPHSTRRLHRKIKRKKERKTEIKVRMVDLQDVIAGGGGGVVAK